MAERFAVPKVVTEATIVRGSCRTFRDAVFSELARQYLSALYEVVHCRAWELVTDDAPPEPDVIVEEKRDV